MPSPFSPDTPESTTTAEINAADEAPIVLDPFGSDLHAEAAQLRERGPVTRAVLPGGVPVWALTSHKHLRSLLSDPRVSKNWRNWGALQRGEVPADWPLLGMVQYTNMLMTDGADHHRLRKHVAATFTARRVQNLAPRIAEIIGELLDDLPNHATGDGVVDLRPHFSYQIPMQVICEMLGVPKPWYPKLRELVDTTFRSTVTSEELVQTQRERVDMLQKLIDLHRAEPGDDLTSALITTMENDPEALSDEEFNDTLYLLITAGHETTLSLISNATLALLTHPEQRELAVSGDRWGDVVEETMRWDAPIASLLGRYPLEDIEVGGVTIPKGEHVMACFLAAGRDPGHYEDAANVFDIRNATTRHLSFGHGPHMCLGAPLARLEGSMALRSLFTRYPDMELGVPAGEITPAPSLFTNTPSALPIRLGKAA